MTGARIPSPGKGKKPVKMKGRSEGTLTRKKAAPKAGSGPFTNALHDRETRLSVERSLDYLGLERPVRKKESVKENSRFRKSVSAFLHETKHPQGDGFIHEYTRNLLENYIGQIGACVASGLKAEDVINMKAWNRFGEEEREHLLKFLPESLSAAEKEDTVNRLLNGENIYFGSPRGRMFNNVAAGHTHPQVRKLRGRVEIAKRRDHMEMLRDYHNQVIRQLKARKACIAARPEPNPAVRPPTAAMANVNTKVDIETSGLPVSSQGRMASNKNASAIKRHHLQDGAASKKRRRISEKKSKVSQPVRMTKSKEGTANTQSDATATCDQVEIRKYLSTTLSVKNTYSPTETNPRAEYEWDADKWEQIKLYRHQEAERYSFPGKAFKYKGHWGEAVVPPLRNMRFTGNSRAREHPLLHSERPAHVTIIALVRDAASRLPNRRGTRSDICSLLLESQYVRSTATIEDANKVMSRALNRLRNDGEYKSVEFNENLKEWHYLHTNEDFNSFTTCE